VPGSDGDGGGIGGKTPAAPSARRPYRVPDLMSLDAQMRLVGRASVGGC
jgi:hypothetical protein